MNEPRGKQTIALCAKRWRWWPTWMPLGEVWSIWEQETTREHAEWLARDLRTRGAIYAEVTTEPYGRVVGDG